MVRPLSSALPLLLAVGAVASTVSETIVELDVRVPMHDGYDSIEWAARQPWSTGAVASRKSQTGELESASAEMQAATIRIHHDSAHPSRLLLPVIPDR